MSSVLITTLGQRPEAITVALDVLLQRVDITHVCITHTHPEHSEIALALASLKKVIRRDYRGFETTYRELRVSDNDPLLDVVDQITAEAYFRGVYSVLTDYRRQGFTLHVLVAGGRKAMSIYATLAAARVLSKMDSLWTVLTPSPLMQSGQYHMPVGLADQVHVIQLPLFDVDTPDWESRRSVFLRVLPKKEREVAQMLTQHPYLRDKELARLLGKSVRTVQNQLASIYDRLEAYLDISQDVVDTRHVLIDLLLGRLEDGVL